MSRSRISQCVLTNCEGAMSIQIAKSEAIKGVPQIVMKIGLDKGTSAGEGEVINATHHYLLCEEDDVTGDPRTRPTKTRFEDASSDVALKNQGKECCKSEEKKGSAARCSLFGKKRSTKFGDMLPEVPARYHGNSCCMEVCILEKHNDGCRYKKKDNPKRNPADDRAGDYEVIGRINFKSCDCGSETIQEEDTRSQGIGVHEEDLEPESQAEVETRSEQTDLDFEETHYVLQVDENIECVLYVSEENLCCCECCSEGGNYEASRSFEEVRNKNGYDGDSLDLQTSVADYQTLICRDTADRGTTADFLMTTDMLNRSVLDSISPIVPSRYHGSRCCVEINVMEKHGDGCRYNDKQINPQKTDSYSLIRRLNILTCSMGDSPIEEPLPPKITLDDVYPILTETHPPGFKLQEELSDEKLSIFEDCFKNKRLVDTLVRSSRSFPNFKSSQEVAVHTADMSTRPIVVQELFFQKKFDRCLETTDRCVQIEANYWRRKKWYYSLFACMLPQY